MTIVGAEYNGIPNIVTLENMVKAITKKEKWAEIEIITGLLNTFTNGFNLVGNFTGKDENENEYIWLLLSTRCFNSMWCAFHLMYSGYYSQAVTIIRSITEDVLICMACPINKKIRDYILSKKGELPSFSSMAKISNAPKIYEMYRHQCKFAHTSNLSLAVLIDKKRVKIAPLYDSMLFDYCMEAFIRTSVMMLEYLGRVIFYIDQSKAKSFNDDNSNNLIRATNWLRTLKKKYAKEIKNNQSQRSNS